MNRNMKSPTVALLTALVTLAHADVPSDLVTSIPGFEATDFNTYSGYLHVLAPLPGTTVLKLPTSSTKHVPTRPVNHSRPGTKVDQGAILSTVYLGRVGTFKSPKTAPTP